jgi:predicted exporter
VLDDLEEGFNAPRVVLYGLLAWLGVQALAAVVAGVILLVGSRRRVLVVAPDVVNPF